MVSPQPPLLEPVPQGNHAFNEMLAGTLPMQLIEGNRHKIYFVAFATNVNHISPQSVLSCALQGIEPASICDDRDLKALPQPAAPAFTWLSNPAVPAWTSL